MGKISEEIKRQTDARIKNNQKEIDELNADIDRWNVEIKIEEKVSTELEKEKTKEAKELLENQKYGIMAFRDMITMNQNKIDELEMDKKLLIRKHDVLANPKMILD